MKNTLSQVNILLVDDRPANLLALEAVLEPLKCNLVKANSGEEALKCLLDLDYAIILLDVQMPGMDGFETATLIKGRAKSCHIPIIFVTAINKEERFIFQGYASGAVDYITKPFDPAVLLAKISIFVDLFTFAQQNQKQAKELLQAERRRQTERRLDERMRSRLDQHHLRELASSEERLREFKSTVDATLDGVFIFDAHDLNFSYTNHGGVGQLGYGPEEILTLTPLDLLPEVDAALLRKKLDSLRDGTIPSYTFQTVQRRKDGSEIPVELFLQFVTPQGKEGRFVAVARDISERVMAEARIEQQFHRLTALRDIDMAITSSLDLRVTLNVLLDQVTSQLQVDAADVLLLNPHTQSLEFATSRGFHSQVSNIEAIRLSESHAGRAVLERKLVYIPNLTEEPGAPARAPVFAKEDFVTYYGVPLIAKGQIRGVLEIFQRSSHTESAEWMEFLNALAGQAAIAIDNATLFDDLQRSNSELMQAYDTTIEGWSRALDLRDKETEGHTLRVTRMAMIMARANGLSSSEMVHIRRGALLHDIGKMGIPDSILLKPGPLTEEEWVIMRQHPFYAFELLSPIAYLRPALDIPYCHHEKWDGSGYPRQLKGEQIPLSARLFAIADVWDALKSDRPYRKGWPDEKIRAHILDGSGTHFDPAAVELFMGLDMESSSIPLELDQLLVPETEL
ncbi:response regulator [bacterium]|nr:MAG: response regulator [bacterium]